MLIQFFYWVSCVELGFVHRVLTVGLMKVINLCASQS